MSPCDGSRWASPGRACPGCSSCMTPGVTCLAFWDEDWRGTKSTTPCVFCGGGPEAHREMPRDPESPPMLGFRIDVEPR